MSNYRIIELQQEYQARLEEVLVSVLNKHQSLGDAAAELGISRPTLRAWIAKCELEQRWVAPPPPPPPPSPTSRDRAFFAVGTEGVARNEQ